MNSLFYGRRPGGHLSENHSQEAPFHPVIHNSQFGTSVDYSLQLPRMFEAMRKDMKEEMSKLHEEMTSLKENISTLNSKVEEAKSRGKGRPKLSLDLSKSVRELHKDLRLQFKGEECYESTHNQGVAQRIINQISKEHEEYTLREVKSATHRHYETKRRRYNDAQPARQEAVERNRIASKKRDYRKRIYDRRQDVCKTKKEKDHWGQLSYEYMTEESDDEENDRVVSHHLTWTSEKLKSLKRRLDAKLKARQAKCGRFKAKERVQGSASTLPSPQYPVEWAVSIVSGSNKDAVTSDCSSLNLSASPETPVFTPVSGSSSLDLSTSFDDNGTTLPASSSSQAVESRGVEILDQSVTPPQSSTSGHCVMRTSTPKHTSVVPSHGVESFSAGSSSITPTSVVSHMTGDTSDWSSQDEEDSEWSGPEN